MKSCWAPDTDEAGYAKAAYDTLHVAAIGPHYRQLIDPYAREVIPHVR